MKKIVSFFLCIVLILTFSVSAFAAEAGGLICPTCGSAVIVHSDTIEGIYHNIEYVCSNKDCDYKRKEKKILGMESVSGATATPIEGVTAPPSGYSGEGKANVTQSGVIVYYVDAYALAPQQNGINFDDGFHKVAQLHNDSIYASSYSGIYYPFRYRVPIVYKFAAPVSGVYVVGNVGDTLDFGRCNFFDDSNSDWFSIDIKKEFVKSSDRYSVSLSKGDEEFFCYSFVNYNASFQGKSFKYSFNSIPIYIQPLGESGITNHNKITINNNTFNGNIYVDNSNKLTYIYPQYTVNNETKISNNPIIYNEETKQYYTYDQTTNNYYYITYGDPAPTPTPDPSPDPGGSTPDPGKPTPTPTPGGSDSSGGGSGSNPFNWLADLLKDIVEGIFKAVWKLTTSIFGFLIWLVGLLGNVLPFLPSEGLAALSAAAIIITVIRIIKFILGR